MSGDSTRADPFAADLDLSDFKPTPSMPAGRTRRKEQDEKGRDEAIQYVEGAKREGVTFAGKF